MISVVQARFANLGMAKKLGVGFALVLMLTAVVAAIGVWSLKSISGHVEGLKQMSSLNGDLLQVRLLEQDYALHGNPKVAEQLRAGVDALNAQAEILKGQSGSSQALMNQVQQALADYRKSFDQFVDISQSKDLALEMARDRKSVV